MWLPNSYGWKQTLESTPGSAASKNAAGTSSMAFGVQPGPRPPPGPSELDHSWQTIRVLWASVSSPENGGNARTCRWFSGLQTAQGERLARGVCHVVRTHCPVATSGTTFYCAPPCPNPAGGNGPTHGACVFREVPGAGGWPARNRAREARRRGGTLS